MLKGVAKRRGGSNKKEVLKTKVLYRKHLS